MQYEVFRHALATPLTTLSYALEWAEQAPQPQPYLQQAQYALEHLHALYAQEAQPSLFSPLETIAKATALAKTQKQRILTTSLTVSPDLKLFGIPFHVTEALVCCLNNAFEAYGNDVLHPTVRLAARTDNHQLILTITDGGKGLRWYERFLVLADGFSTKGHDRGRGLTFVKQVVERELRGKLEIKSAYGRGTTVSWLLPCVTKPANGV